MKIWLLSTIKTTFKHSSLLSNGYLHIKKTGHGETLQWPDINYENTAI